MIELGQSGDAGTSCRSRGVFKWSALELQPRRRRFRRHAGPNTAGATEVLRLRTIEDLKSFRAILLLEGVEEPHKQARDES